VPSKNIAPWLAAHSGQGGDADKLEVF